MLKLVGIAKFQQVSVDGNRLEFGTPKDSALRKLAKIRHFRTETVSFSIVSAEFQQGGNDIFHPVIYTFTSLSVDNVEIFPFPVVNGGIQQIT